MAQSAGYSQFELVSKFPFSYKRSYSGFPSSSFVLFPPLTVSPVSALYWTLGEAQRESRCWKGKKIHPLHGKKDVSLELRDEKG